MNTSIPQWNALPRWAKLATLPLIIIGITMVIQAVLSLLAGVFTMAAVVVNTARDLRRGKHNGYKTTDPPTINAA